MEPSIQTLNRLAPRALNVSEASLLGDERAAMEAFFAVLADRGIKIETKEQATRLAGSFADMITSAGGVGRVAPLGATAFA